MMEYRVVYVMKDMGELVTAVNKYIKEGWRPQGGVCHYFTSTIGLRNDFWAQAMVRETK